MADASRVIIVHTSEQVRAAFEAASQLGARLTLQSAPGALYYAGGLYLLRMFTRIRQEFPDVDATFILDCGDAGAESLFAIQAGHTHVRLNAPPELQAKLEDVARQRHVTVVTDPFEAIELREQRDYVATCREWLARAA